MGLVRPPHLGSIGSVRSSLGTKLNGSVGSAWFGLHFGAGGGGRFDRFGAVESWYQTQPRLGSGQVRGVWFSWFGSARPSLGGGLGSIGSVRFDS